VTFPTNGGRGVRPAYLPAKESVIMVKKHHSVAYQDQACKLVTDGGMSQVDAAKQLGIHPVTLRKWLTKRGLVTPIEFVEPDYVKSNDPAELKSRIRELEKQLRRSETEKEILKKATAFFASLSN
jgi:transposase